MTLPGGMWQIDSAVLYAFFEKSTHGKTENLIVAHPAYYRSRLHDWMNRFVCRINFP